MNEYIVTYSIMTNDSARLVSENCYTLLFCDSELEARELALMELKILGIDNRYVVVFHEIYVID